MTKDHIVLEDKNVSLKSVVFLLKKHRVFFASCALAFMGLGLVLFFVFNQYQAEAQVFVSEDHTLILENLADPLNLTHSFKADDAKNGLKSASVQLKSYQFYQDFLSSYCQSEGKPVICSSLKSDVAVAALGLLKKVDVVVDDTQLLKVTFKDRSSEAAAETLNAMLVFLFQKIEKRQNELVSKLIEELKFKKIELEARLKSRIRDLSQMGHLSLAAVNSGRVFDYLGDTQIKISETSMKILENEKAIQILSQRMKGSLEQDTAYGPVVKIESLKAENELLKERRRQMQAQIKSGLDHQFLTSSKSESLTSLNEKLEVDKAAYESVLKALARLDLISVTQNKEFEILQKAEPLLAKATLPPFVVLLCSLFLSQLLACLLLILKAVWQQDSVRELEPYHSPWIVDPQGPSVGLKSGVNSDQRFILHPQMTDFHKDRSPHFFSSHPRQ